MTHPGQASWRDACVRWLFRSVAAGIVLFYFGPFANPPELLRLAHESGASAFSRLYEPRHQEDIAVVLVQDADLRALQADWPVPYSRWSQLLRLLGCAQAKAVFFDLALSRPEAFVQQDEPGTAALAQMDHRVNHGQLTPADCPGRTTEQLKAVPVYYGHLSAPGETLPGLIPEARKLPISWVGSPQAYPLTPRVQGTGHLSVAYRLLKHYCATPGAPAHPAHPACLGDWAAGTLDQSLVPRWPTRVPPSQSGWREGTEACVAHAPGNGREALLQWLQSWFEDEPTVYPQCQPFLTLSLSQVLQDFDRDMADTLRGRTVLIGTRLSGAADLIPTPTHGQLPGVYLHAVALENLLTMGERFDRIDAAHISWLAVLFVLAVSLVHPLLHRLSGPAQGDCTLARDLLQGLPIFVLAAWALRTGALCPPGLVPSLAFMLTLGVLMGDLSAEGTVFGCINALFSKSPATTPTDESTP